VLGLNVNAQNREPEPRLLRCYPSPATTYIQIELKRQVKPAKLQIFNAATGREMYAIVSSGNEVMRVNLNDYARGTYIVQLSNPTGGRLDVGKFEVYK